MTSRIASWIGSLEAKLTASGIAHRQLDSTEANAAVQRWRQVFSVRVHAATGNWLHAGYDWHAFSYGFTPAIEGPDAVKAYREAWANLGSARVARPFLLTVRYPQSGALLVYRCTSVVPPLLGEHDELITPVDFRWTMAFPHEEGWLGPYFTTPALAKSTPSGDPRSMEGKRSRRR